MEYVFRLPLIVFLLGEMDAGALPGPHHGGHHRGWIRGNHHCSRPLLVQHSPR